MFSILRLSLGLLLICSGNIMFSQCAGAVSFTLSTPPSGAGTYPPGSVVDLCLTMTGWNGLGSGSNWMEGFGLNLGSGWASVTPITYPEDCGGPAPPFSWVWVNSVTSSATGATAGPGFFYDGTTGPVDGDGDPGNDWGDSGGPECNWSFCVQLVASNLPGVDLSLSVNIYSDGDMGNYTNNACVGVDPPSIVTPIGTITENCTILGCVDANACNFNAAANCDDGSCINPACGDASACNYEPTAPCFDNNLCIPSGCIDFTACNVDPNAGCDDGSCVFPGCTDAIACNFDAAAGCDNGSCIFPGCTDAIACNFDVAAGCDDGSCVFPGCDDNTACNFDAAAGCSDGSCTFPGCTDVLACNYDFIAGCDDGSCTFPGCTAPLACNFSATAACDDGSCYYMNTGIITHDAMPCPDIVCIGYRETYSTSGFSNSNFQWQLTNGGGVILDSYGTNCDIIWGNTPGQYTLTVQETTSDGCIGDIQTCTVDVIIPQIEFDTNYHEICLNGSVPLFASPSGGSWESDFMQGSTFTGTTAGSYRAYYSTVIEDCLTEDFVTVDVKPLLDTPQLIKADTLVDLCKEANQQYYEVYANEGVYYEWRIENTLLAEAAETVEIIWQDTTRDYLISVTGFDTLGCKSAPLDFYVTSLGCELFFAPTTFTPNGDGLNDRFFAQGTSLYHSQLRIYDRWGKMIYQTDQLEKGWSGDDGTGYYAPNGVYFWQLDYQNAEGQKKEKQGFVVMNR